MSKETTFSPVAITSAVPPVFIPVDAPAYTELVDALRISGSTQDPLAATSAALRHYSAWLLNKEPKEEGASQDEDSLNVGTFDAPGYIWRYKTARVFMANGTELYADHKGQRHFAKVVNKQIIYNGTPVSPGALANKIAGGVMRNAWRDLWVKRPGDKDFILADDLRKDPANRSFEEKHDRKHPPIPFSEAINAIATLRKLSFPEELFFPMHHMNKTRNSVTMQNFDDYAHRYDKCSWDSNNGCVTRRLLFIVENYSGQKSHKDWVELVDRAIKAIPFAN